MKIKSLTLEGYVRLLYAGIKRIVYRPESAYQLIIGTNGSGKSSLLAELSPLPASKQDYLAGGSKKVVIEDDEGLEYILISEFKSGNRHTFIRDGVVLNDAGTAATQKELVEQYFKYNADLHALLTGEIRFTTMGPQQRREWISRACTSDVTEALAMFAKLKTAARDAVGARKHAETRLAVEYKGLFTEEELQQLQERIDELTRTITALMYDVDNEVPPRVDAMRRYEECLAELKSISKDQVLSMDARSLDGLGNGSTIRDNVRYLEGEHRRITANLAERKREYVELEDTIAQMTKMVGTGGNTLTDELKQLQEKLGTYYGHKLDFDFGEADFIYLYRLAEELDGPLTDKLLALPPNPGRRYNKEALEAAQYKQDELVNARTVKTTELTRLNSRKETIQGAAKTTCPRCSYVWVPGVSENDLRVIVEKIELLETQLNQINEASKRNALWLEELLEWRRLFTDFRGLMGLNSLLAPLWREFAMNDLVYEDPNACVHLFYRWKQQLGVLAERTRIENRIDEINVVLKRAEEISGGGSGAVLTQRAQQIAQQVADLTEEEIKIRVALDRANGNLRLAGEWEGVNNRLRVAIERANAAMTTAVKSQLQEEFKHAISKHQSELAQLNAQLSERKSARDVVQSLERQREELLQKEEDLKILIDNMSPTDGMIADQLSSCINLLIEQMNEFIRCVWTYDLVVKPCGLDGASLDYKFPMEIKGRPRLVSDISKGSGAQQNIVDFTFILVVLSFMNLQGYPLYPDELGSTFDPEHRMRLIGFFKQLVESRRTSQLFYISHNPEVHETLVNADVCVMDFANVGKIPNANRVVEFEYAT